jgi:hypothetical protein
MKKLIYPAWILAFFIIFQFSCQPIEPIDPIQHNMSPYYTVDISDIIGNWTATKVEYNIGAASMDVSEHFSEITLTINEFRGYCCINRCDYLFTVQGWQEKGGNHFNIFTNPETHDLISMNILERNDKVMKASVKNLSPYMYRLFPDEDSNGQYTIHFARQ